MAEEPPRQPPRTNPTVGLSSSPRQVGPDTGQEGAARARQKAKVELESDDIVFPKRNKEDADRRAFSEDALWVDEPSRFTTREQLFWHYVGKLTNRGWVIIVGFTIFLDLVSWVYSLACTSDGCPLQGHDVVVGWLVVVVLILDLAWRIYDQGRQILTLCVFYLDLVILTMSLIDVLMIFEGVPLPTAPMRLLRLLRPLLLSSTIIMDTLVDSAMDKLLEMVLGEVMYIRSDNVTCQPSEGLFVMSKTHLRPEFFADLYLPITVKGGFLEHVFVDFEKSSHSKLRDFSEILGGRQSKEGGGEEEDPEDPEQGVTSGFTGVMTVSNLLLVLGPGSLQDLDFETCVKEKDKLVKFLAKRSEGKAKSKRKRKHSIKQAASPIAPLDALKKQLASLANVDLSDFSVEIRNIEIRFEDEAMTAALQLGGVELRTCVGTPAEMESAKFRAASVWHHDKANPRSGPSTLTRNFGPPLRVAMRCFNVAAWCDLVGEDTFHHRRHLLFTNYFQNGEVYKAVQHFRRLCLVERWKQGALDAVATTRLQGSAAVATGTTSFLLHNFQEKICLHHYLLLPCSFSLHATSRTDDVPVEEAPAQVLDIRTARLHFQIDHDQVKRFRQLECHLTEWLNRDKSLARVPMKRISDAKRPKERAQLARAWWNFAGAQVANGLSPAGQVCRALDLQRISKNKALFETRLVEQQIAEAKILDKLKNTARGVTLKSLRVDDLLPEAQPPVEATSSRSRQEQIRRLQFSLPLKDAIDAHAVAFQRYLDITAGPAPYEHKPGPNKRTLEQARTGLASQGGLRKQLSFSSSMMQAPEVGVEVRVAIANLSCVVLQPPTALWSANQIRISLGGELRSKLELMEPRAQTFRAHGGDLALVFMRNPPAKAWYDMCGAVANAMEPGERADPASAGPIDPEQGTPITGWFALRASVQSCLVEAPDQRPALRTIVRRSLIEGHSVEPVASLRLAKWQRLDETHAGRSHLKKRAVVAVRLCQVSVVEYHPLMMGLKNLFLTKATPRVDDRFQLGDVRARLLAHRTVRHRALKLLRYFELGSGIKAEGKRGRQGATWRVFVSTEGASLVAVTPFAKRSLLVGHFACPRAAECFQRSHRPPVLESGKLVPDETFEVRMPSPRVSWPRSGRSVSKEAAVISEAAPTAALAESEHSFPFYATWFAKMCFPDRTCEGAEDAAKEDMLQETRQEDAVTLSPRTNHDPAAEAAKEDRLKGLYKNMAGSFEVVSPDDLVPALRSRNARRSSRYGP